MSDIFKFERNRTLLSGDSALGISIEAIKDPQVAAALAQNKAFPSGDVRLGDISVNGEGEGDINFDGPKGKVNFKASAEAHAGLGVYFDLNQLLDALDPSEKISSALNFSSAPNSLYMLLNWGYDLSASAKGSVAFGANPLTVTFGGDAQRTGAYAVIRRLNRDIGARDAIQETANSWVLPTQVESLDQLPAGTWLIAEVDGSVALSLGAAFGYDFNWTRETKFGGLSGDLGLRIEAGIKVALGFEASGKYALVIGRESADDANKKVCLRLFRQRKRGWSFSFDANASIQANNTLLPKNLDDFIGAVFGIHGAQIVKDLGILDKWTNVETDPSTLLAGFTLEYAKKFLGSVTGELNLDVIANLTKARDLLLDVIHRWNDLDHEVVSILMKFAGQSSELVKIRAFAQKIAGATDKTKIKTEIKELVEQIGFHDLPEAKWLETAVAGGLASLLSDSDEFNKLRDMATKTLALLDGSRIQEIFERLQDYINQNIQLAKIEADLSKANFDTLDDWLKARLSAFLGETIDFTKFQQLQATISELRKKSQDFYKSTLKALTDKYKVEFEFTYQKTTTGSALIDIEFDFATAGVGASLQEAVAGKFDGLMVQQRPGVQLRVATLTHEISRNTHVELTLPFFGKQEMDHLTESIATVNATDDDGRVLVYGLDAKDIVSSKNQRNSTVTLAGMVQLMAGNQVRVFSKAHLNYAYSLRQAKKGMKRADLKYQLSSYMDTDSASNTPLLSGVFSASQNGGPASGSLERWFADVDDAVESQLHNGPDTFGNTLLSVQIGVGTKVTEAWLKASDDDLSPRYLEMSRRLQSKLKQLVPFIYLQKAERFEDERARAAALLVYSAIPPSTQISLSGNQLTIDVPTGIYWDYLDPHKVLAMIGHPRTASTLTNKLRDAFDRLSKTEGMEKVAQDYKPTAAHVKRIMDLALDAGSSSLHALLRTESMTVREAREVGLKLAAFKKTASTEPTKAVKLLAEFGNKFTDAFNTELGGMHGGFNARPLGTLLLIEAALALDVSLSPKDIKMSSILELIVLKDSSSFKLADYIDGVAPKKEECVLQQRIVSLGN